MKKSVKLFAGFLVLAILALGIINMTAMAGAVPDKETGADPAVLPQEEKDAKAEKDAKEHSAGGKKHGVCVDVLSVAASVLEMSKDDVKEAVKIGKVGDLLIAANKVGEFKTAYLSDLKEKLDAAVAAGTLTKEQADEKYAAGKEKMDAYDGTTHPCGKEDHSQMFEKKTFDKNSKTVKNIEKEKTAEKSA
jgi:hypothetical protein